MISDLEIIREVKQDNFQHFEELAGRHSGICFQIAKPYILAGSGSLTYDALQSQHQEIILSSAKSYGEDKGCKFVTWVSSQTRFWCLNQLNQLKQPDTFPIGDNLELIEGAAEQEDYEMTGNLEEIKNLLNQYNHEQTKKVVNLRYFSGSRKPVSFKEIGKNMGLSAARIEQIVKKFIEYARERLGKREIVLN